MNREELEKRLQEIEQENKAADVEICSREQAIRKFETELAEVTAQYSKARTARQNAIADNLNTNELTKQVEELRMQVELKSDAIEGNKRRLEGLRIKVQSLADEKLQLSIELDSLQFQSLITLHRGLQKQLAKITAQILALRAGDGLGSFRNGVVCGNSICSVSESGHIETYWSRAGGLIITQ